MSQDQAALQGADQSSMNPSADGFPDPMTLIQGAAFLGIGNNTMQRLARTGAIKTEQIKDCLGRTCKGVRQAGLLDLKPCLDTAELLRQSGDALKVEPGSNLLALEKVAGWTPAMTDAATHSPDFTEVNWFGTPYVFTKGVQAQCVRVLWEAWENGTLSLAEKTIGKHVDPDNDSFQLQKVFGNTGRNFHPAWGAMIQVSSDGNYYIEDEDDLGEFMPKMPESETVQRTLEFKAV